MYILFTKESHKPPQKLFYLHNRCFSHFSRFKFPYKDNKNNQPRKGLANNFVEKSGKLVLQWQDFLAWSRKSVDS